MANYTAIEWTDATWNPTTGCTKISKGCQNCYAERFAERFRGTSGHPFEQGFDLKLWPARISLPLSWRRPRRVFVNSMSDLFHSSVPTEFISQVFDTMEKANHHIYQVLTKRGEIMRDFINRRYPDKAAPPHIWLGVSVENRKTVSRIDHLQETNASGRFLSVEPLLERLGMIDLTGIHWVIVGGESGPRHRPLKAEWVREVRNQCLAVNVPFFFKQWGGIRPKSGGNEIDGQTWLQFPQTEAFA